MRCMTLGLVAALLAGAADAGPLKRQSQVWLEAADGARIKIADLTTDSEGQFAVTMNAQVFSDHFLSMRPFRCLSDANRQWCHLPYPYANAMRVSDGDLTDLEYSFLFVSKSVGDYGIDLWNGVYYVLAPEGDTLVGRQHGVDLNLLAVPPPPGQMRPITVRDMTLTEPAESWLPRLVID